MLRSILRIEPLCHRMVHRRLFSNLSRQQWNSLVASNVKLNYRSIRCINTTDKKKDHTHIDIYDPNYVDVKKPKGPETAEDFADLSSQKNWISEGFDLVDPTEDQHLKKFFFFAFVTVGVVFFMYILYYIPDYRLKDWAMREAFLELDRREKLGLPLIDPNLVPPENLHLPTEEELNEMDVEVYI